MAPSLSDKILMEIALGGYVRRDRNFPFSATFKLCSESGAAVKEVTEGAVRQLVDRGYIRGTPQDQMWDIVHFRVTEAGSVAAGKLATRRAA